MDSNRNTPNELDELFAGKKAQIHELKTTNAHFAKLADAYHELNREVHRMETNVEPASDQRMEEARKRRLKLLDEIGSMLFKAG